MEDRQGAITSQPAWQDQSGDTHVRYMTLEDAEFEGTLAVEAFRSKFECAVGKSRISKLMAVMRNINRRLSPESLQQKFVAMYKGERAGTMTLGFHEKPHQDTDGMCGDICGGLCCCCALRLLCVFGMLDEDVARGYCYLDMICVDAKFRGKGIGQALLKRADEEARRRGCHTIYLTVLQSNRAKSLYERHGYTITSSENGYCCTACLIGESRFYRMDKKLQ